jgi:hypothetical protein
LDTPQQQIQAFLADHRIHPSRQLQVSLAFTGSMLLELQTVLAEWQVILASLQQAEAEVRQALVRSN